MHGSTILVASDLSENSVSAAVWANDLGRLTGQPVVVAHVVEIGFDSWLHSKYEVALDESKMADVRDQVSQWFEMSTGEPPGGVDVRVDYCVTGLTEAVEQYDAGILVVAASGKGAVARAVMGSRVQQLASRPPAPLAIVDPGSDRIGEPPRLAVAMDFSLTSVTALEFAGSLAALVNGPLTEIYVLDPPKGSLLQRAPTEEELVSLQAQAEEELKRLADEHLSGDAEVDTQVLSGQPAQALVDYARQERLDIMVVGQTGHGSVPGDFMGSTPRRLIRDLSETLIIVPASAPETPSA